MSWLKVLLKVLLLLTSAAASCTALLASALLAGPPALFFSFLPLSLNPFKRNCYQAIPYAPLLLHSLSPRRAAFTKWWFGLVFCYRCLYLRLTRPLRTSLPSLYILGTQEAGGNVIAQHLLRIPGVASVVKMNMYSTRPGESHFFQGILGRSSAHQPGLLAMLCPSVLAHWYATAVQGWDRLVVFDATPANLSLPYVAERMAAVTPGARIIIMVRDPIDAALPAEVFRGPFGMSARRPGIPSFTDKVRTDDPRFHQGPFEERLWKEMKALGPTDPVPEGAMEALYLGPASWIHTGKLYENIQPFLKHFKMEQILFVPYPALLKDEQAVMTDVRRFLGIENRPFSFQPVLPGSGSAPSGPSSDSSAPGSGSHTSAQDPPGQIHLQIEEAPSSYSSPRTAAAAAAPGLTQLQLPAKGSAGQGGANGSATDPELHLHPTVRARLEALLAGPNALLEAFLAGKGRERTVRVPAAEGGGSAGSDKSYAY